VSVIRQYLEAALLDELHLAVAPVILGRGENLFAGLDLDRLGYRVERNVEAPGALHVFLTRGSS
jgi:dihydrofolate reductase